MESALHVAADHPAYAGHFPGRPILPGVVIVSEALAAIARDTGREAHRWTISGAKFLRPVAPGTRLTLSHIQEGEGVRFEVRAAEGVVASGTLKPRP
jgi:3-hydroxymyristoyl/3-hydroxydecanoyl-(acyl carrier protein) dehydratase